MERTATWVARSAADSRSRPGTDIARGKLMSIDDIKKRFVDEIKLRAFDDRYIDKIEEREILQIAIQLGVDLEGARAALVQVCAENDFIIESRIVKLIKDQVHTAAGNEGVVGQREFETVFAKDASGEGIYA